MRYGILLIFAIAGCSSSERLDKELESEMFSDLPSAAVYYETVSAKAGATSGPNRLYLVDLKGGDSREYCKSLISKLDGRMTDTGCKGAGLVPSANAHVTFTAADEFVVVKVYFE